MKASEQINILKKSKYFDEEWYLKTYPEIGRLGMDPAVHFLRYGAQMLRHPGPQFDTAYYRDTYQGGDDGGVNPLVHYLTEGAADEEQRLVPAEDEQALVSLLESRLFDLKSMQQALGDLALLAQNGKTLDTRLSAKLALASWHLRQGTDDELQMALSLIANADQEAMGVKNRSSAVALKLIALARQGAADPAADLYRAAALAGSATPEVLLAFAAFQADPSIRLIFVNQALKGLGLAPLALEDAPERSLLERLRPDVALAPVTDGTQVSVLVDARDPESDSLAALLSLSYQSWTNLEVLVVFDPLSPVLDREEVTRIGKGFAAFNRIGISSGASLDGVVAKANGTYVLTLSSRTWLMPSAIEKLTRALDASPDAAGCRLQSVYCDLDLKVRLHKGPGIVISADTNLVMRRKSGGATGKPLAPSGGLLAFCATRLTRAETERATGPLTYDFAVVADLRDGSPDVGNVVSLLTYARITDRLVALVNVARWRGAGRGAALAPEIVEALGAGHARLPKQDSTLDAALTLVANPQLSLIGRTDLPRFLKAEDSSGLPADSQALLPFVSTSTFRLTVSERSERGTPDYKVGSLLNWLWGGFSEAARVELERIVNVGGGAQKSERANAAFSLARWYAAAGEWEQTHRILRQLSKIDVKTYRTKRSKILQTEAFIQLGNFDKAETMIDFALTKQIDGDFCCARSNLLLFEAAADARERRIAAINDIYIAGGYLPITFPEEGESLRFGDWVCEPGPELLVHDGPKVSILMPVYNAEHFIETSVRSILSQTWRNIEIIAVEDCGPDNSWTKLEALAKEDGRLKIFRNEHNRGAYPTRNRALSLATGEFITVHDSDDWSHPQMIEVQMRTMMEQPELKATFTHMARVYEDLRFMLRPQRNNLEYVHRSYPSLLIRRADVNVLGEWDGVSANADDEFVQRIRMAWGQDSVKDLETNVPFSFFLVHAESLTQQKGTSLNSLTFGIRQEYARQATYWRKKIAATGGTLEYTRASLKDPFPIPTGLAPKNWPRDRRYDIVLISDLSLLGGTRRCNEGYIRAAIDAGLRVGLFHWPRFDLHPAEIAAEYTELSYHPLVDFLVPEDEITAELVLIHHPPILKHRIDGVPKIATERVAILVNQSPMQLFSEAPHYYDGPSCEALCRDFFGVDPVWLPIAPRVVEILQAVGGFGEIAEEIWYPPYGGTLPEAMPTLPLGLGEERTLILGRHARDHWTKWPSEAGMLRRAYCAEEAQITTRFMGGLSTPKKILGTLPGNWEDIAFDAIDVSEFVSGLDFFVHFVHADYIEEFGRNIMEAMAAGRVVILPWDFRDTFGEAAVYCAPHEVADTMRRLWFRPEAYRAQAQSGFDFVREASSLDSVLRRLQELLPVTSAPGPM